MSDKTFTPTDLGAVVIPVDPAEPGVAYTGTDGPHTYTVQLDRVEPAVLAERPRRTLRMMEVLLEEALDNVRDALHAKQNSAARP